MLFQSLVLAAATFLATLARADYDIDPESVDISLRENWCTTAKETCPLICMQYDATEAIVNDCDPETLFYGCLCDNNVRPNVSEYSLTIPFFMCQEWGNQCEKDCGNDATCATSCREDNPCGAQTPRLPTPLPTTLAPTASASETEDNTVIYTGSPGTRDDDDDGAASLLTLGSNHGLTVIMGGMFLVFALF